MKPLLPEPLCSNGFNLFRVFLGAGRTGLLLALLSMVWRAEAADFNVIIIAPGGYGGAVQFQINGQAPNPQLTLMRGQLYTFAIATVGHPFLIRTPDGVPYNTGVTNNNITNGTLTIAVTDTTPATLRYICSLHGFGSIINVVSPPPPSAFGIISMTMTGNNVVLRSRGTNGWLTVPEFSSNLFSSNWAVVPGYTNTLVTGTNITVFNRLDPICGSNVFLRTRSAPN